MKFYNTYEDSRRASAYDQLDLGGTYHLAFRDLPALLREHVAGDRAVDLGCGTGRSTYRSVYRESGLEVRQVEKPLATTVEEGMQWISEARIAPWAVYVLRHMV